MATSTPVRYGSDLAMRVRRLIAHATSTAATAARHVRRSAHIAYTLVAFAATSPKAALRTAAGYALRFLARATVLIGTRAAKTACQLALSALKLCCFVACATATSAVRKTAALCKRQSTKSGRGASRAGSHTPPALWRGRRG